MGRLSTKGTLPNAARMVLQMINTIKEGNADSLSGYQSHYDDILRAKGERLETLHILGTGMHEYTGKPVLIDKIFEIFGMVYTNALTLSTSSMDSIGICLDPLVAKINHSCEPNAFVVYDGPRLSVRSLRPIKEDEEVFIAYTDGTSSFRQRQKQLQEQYYFTCQCSKCTQKENAPQEAFLPGVPPPNPGVTAVIEDNALKNLESVKDQSLVPTTLKLCELIDARISACLETKAWPVHRQPLPALLQEYFINILMINNYIDAFRRGLQIYFDVHPILYPQTSHPARSLHIFAIAKLAMQCFMGDPKGLETSLPKDLDSHVVVPGLMREAEDALKRSHGVDCRLTKSVKQQSASIMEGFAAIGNEKAQKERQWTLLRAWAAEVIPMHFTGPSAHERIMGR